MNTKRQTIWLVSMLSLMVVLSAYYLFTSGSEDADKLASMANQQTLQNQTKVNITEDGKNAQLQKDPILGEDTKDPNKSTDTAAVQGTDKTKMDATTMTDDEIISKATDKAVSGTDYFIQKDMERHDKITKELDKWITISTDVNQTKEAVGEAMDNIRRIDETQAKIEQIEETLGKDFPHALVQQSDDGRWKVTVQADKMEKKDAVAIIDLVMKEMNIGADKFAGVQLVE
ncbi:SpoIIIAH-like family protein [Paenibacillus albiflavus]|uniref:SpoIIIAH-like family protein n=1 Tax=Paenibacillus albiflavus TaxID=2545760 RepID=A0A4V2WNZ6_9BACL|nr:SpoIIIAH-like family protein [Paenibacillus albiflavus]TCZ77452.1 SpoIIIAH-like family protein [Paenibacillus albiflavus]